MTTGLRRVIGVRTLTLSVINFIIGSAIFVVPAAAAKELGSAAVLAYLVAAALVLTVALCFAAGFVVATLMLGRQRPGGIPGNGRSEPRTWRPPRALPLAVVRRLHHFPCCSRSSEPSSNSPFSTPSVS